MQRIIKDISIQVFCNFVISTIVYLTTASLFIASIIFFGFLLLTLIKPTLLVLNKLIKRTIWYKSKVGDGLKFRKEISRNLDICNLGSNSGKYAFNYKNTELKGENWAIGPQSLSYDFRVLKNYFSYLKGGATIIFPLCPFSGCVKDYENDMANYKYYSFLHPSQILNYSPITRRKIMRFVNTPFQASPFKSILRLIKDINPMRNKIMDEESFEKNAQEFITNWKQEFSIIDLDAPLTENNKITIVYNSKLLGEIVSFCLDRNLKPVIVLPPVSKALSSKYSETFRENYIYSLIHNANLKQVLFLNYFDDERFAANELYFNSYFLNSIGQELFTKQILKDLNLNIL